jgi:arylsulfatase A-like enzyme
MTTFFRPGIFALFFLIFMGYGSLHAQNGTPGDPPPNVVIIFVDDQGYGDLSSYGHETIETPNIDRLGEEGLRLTDYYAGQNVCTPSRAALMTGSYAKRVGLHNGVLFPHHDRGLNPEETTLADMLKEQGYATGAFGKWHLGSKAGLFPTDNGFDEWFGVPYSNDMARKRGTGHTSSRNLDEDWEKHGESWNRYNVPLIRAKAGEEPETLEQPMNQVTLTDRLTDAAVDFIERHQDEPFFVYLPHPQPHIPLYVSEERYDPDVRRAYELVIEHLDASTGRVLEKLEELGLAENTIVIYSSDNGPWLSKKHHGGTAGPLRSGKQHTYDGGHRVPFLIRWPQGLPAGEVFNGLMTNMDVLPTLAAATNAPMPEKEIDGYNMLPTLRGEAPNPRTTYLYYSNKGELEAIRRGGWKLRQTGKPEKKRTELYNLTQDVGERKNLAGAHPELVEELLTQMQAEDRRIEEGARPVGKVE